MRYTSCPFHAVEIFISLKNRLFLQIMTLTTNVGYILTSSNQKITKGGAYNTVYSIMIASIFGFKGTIYIHPPMDRDFQCSITSTRMNYVTTLHFPMTSGIKDSLLKCQMTLRKLQNDLKLREEATMLDFVFNTPSLWLMRNNFLLS